MQIYYNKKDHTYNNETCCLLKFLSAVKGHSCMLITYSFYWELHSISIQSQTLYIAGWVDCVPQGTNAVTCSVLAVLAVCSLACLEWCEYSVYTLYTEPQSPDPIPTLVLSLLPIDIIYSGVCVRFFFVCCSFCALLCVTFLWKIFSSVYIFLQGMQEDRNSNNLNQKMFNNFSY